MSRCVKVGEHAGDVAEGLNAGMRVVAISESETKWPELAQLAALAPSERAARLTAAEERLRGAGAHYGATQCGGVAGMDWTKSKS
jgi:phosphonoacetaldehyde hydrolase